MALLTDPLTCIGIDLAWSGRNPSGLAVIQGDAHGGTLIESRILTTDVDILDYVATYAGNGSVVIGVDAPLWVPNETGRRRAEAEISQAFRKYQAGAHPANRQLLAKYGRIRGEDLVTALADQGFVAVAGIEAEKQGRWVTEVFPHPAMVALFNLDCTLKYKAKPNRSLEFRQQEWQRYQTYLGELSGADPFLQGHDSVLEVDVAQLKGRRLKNYEDRIDAVMCAYIALYGFRWGSERCQTFGTFEEGYIFTPIR